MAARDERARALVDLLVFAPVGLLLTAAEDLPGLIEKGRSSMELQVSNARFLGQLVVTKGRRSWHARTDVQGDRSAHRSSGTAQPVPSRQPAPAAPYDRSVTLPGDGAGLGGRPTDDPRALSDARREPPASIPGYDSLSASQVVRRLDGLGPNELRAVNRYETETRGRRTILHRVQQLLGAEAQPGRLPAAD